MVHCDNQDDAAFATVVAKREWCSVDLCEHYFLGSVHERCFHEDLGDTQYRLALVAPSGLKYLRTHGYVSASFENAVDWTIRRAVTSVKNLEQCGSC